MKECWVNAYEDLTGERKLGSKYKDCVFLDCESIHVRKYYGLRRLYRIHIRMK
jgi:hypothetical protein